MPYAPYNPPYTYTPYTPTTLMPQQAVSAPAPVVPAAANAGFMCRPVTSRAEVEAYQIPFDGSSTYFVDTSNGKIYSKAFDFNTGSAPIVTYVRETQQVIKYATMDDLEALREELLAKKKGVKKTDAEE